MRFTFFLNPSRSSRHDFCSLKAHRSKTLGECARSASDYIPSTHRFHCASAAARLRSLLGSLNPTASCSGQSKGQRPEGRRQDDASTALTAASMLAGDSSFGLESIEMMLRRIVSTCTLRPRRYAPVALTHQKSHAVTSPSSLLSTTDHCPQTSASARCPPTKNLLTPNLPHRYRRSCHYHSLPKRPFLSPTHASLVSSSLSRSPGNSPHCFLRRHTV